MNQKHQLRTEFREAVFRRDRHRCAMCGFAISEYLSDEQAQHFTHDFLDAHHICDRRWMPFGGSTVTNGITLCTDRCRRSSRIQTNIDCHRLAELLNATGKPAPGYSPADLYARIQSSYWIAYLDSLRLGLNESEADQIHLILSRVLMDEQHLMIQLEEAHPSDSTWELACDRIGANEPIVRKYCFGRTYSDTK